MNPRRNLQPSPSLLPPAMHHGGRLAERKMLARNSKRALSTHRWTGSLASTAVGAAARAPNVNVVAMCRRVLPMER